MCYWSFVVAAHQTGRKISEGINNAAAKADDVAGNVTDAVHDAAQSVQDDTR